MNVIFALPRSSSRPSWSVTRTFCSLSEGLGGAVDADFGKFKPIKKKKKRVQPREVDVCLCSEDIEENAKQPKGVGAKAPLLTENRGLRSGPTVD